MIVLSRKRTICVALNKNVESSKVAAYCFDNMYPLRKFDSSGSHGSKVQIFGGPD